MSDNVNPNQLSVQPPWCRELSLQQQSVLFLAARGADGIAKNHPSKRVQRAYRGTVLVAAERKRCLYIGETGDSFMSLHDFASPVAWNSALNDYFACVDELPHHYHMHLMHGALILGYKHPAAEFRLRWAEFTSRAAFDMHLFVETEEGMDVRLNDDFGGLPH